LKTKAPAQFRWQFSREIVVEKANAAQITILPKVTRNSAREVIREKRDYHQISEARNGVRQLPIELVSVEIKSLQRCHISNLRWDYATEIDGEKL